MYQLIYKPKIYKLTFLGNFTIYNLHFIILQIGGNYPTYFYFKYDEK